MFGKIAGAVKSGLGMANTALGAAAPYLGAIDARKQQQAQYDNQKEFAQHGIRWRVADAKAAGIHPLYALGAQTNSYAPSAVGAMPSMGQSVSDSISRTSTRPQQMQLQMNHLATERARLENDLIRSQIQASQVATAQSLRQPAFPSGGLTGSPELDSMVVRTPMQQTPTNNPHQEVTHNPSVGYLMNPDASQMPVMGEQAKQRLEEDIPGMLWWNVLNRLLPNLGIMQSPPNTPPKQGYEWYYHRGLQSYKQRPKSSGRSAPTGFRNYLLQGHPDA